MPIIEIDGVGRVEVDDAFLSMPPAQQDATISEIAAQARPSPAPPRKGNAGRNVTVTFEDGTSHIYRNVPAAITPEEVTERAQRDFGLTVTALDGGRGSPSPSPAAAPAPSAPEPEASTIIDPAQAAIDAAGVENMPAGSRVQFSDEWFARQEADYQASLQVQGYPSALDAPPAHKATSALDAGALGAFDGLTFGTLDELGAVADSILGGGQKSIWDGSSFADAYRANVAANREKLGQAQDDQPTAFLAGGVAGGLVPITGAIGTAAKAATALGKLKTAAKTGAAYGAAYGAGSDTGNPLDRLDGAAMGAGLGAAGGLALGGAAQAGGAVLSPLARKALPKLAEAQFAKQQAGNPFAAVDAEVSADVKALADAMNATAGRVQAKSARAALSRRVDELERSYLPTEEVKALDLPPSVKTRLTTAMARRHILPEADIDALRAEGPAGEAVAEGITKARRLRSYVPDASPASAGTGSGGPAGLVGEVGGSLAGNAIGGPLGGAIGGRVGRGLSRLRSSDSQGDAALRLAKDADSFAKLPAVRDAASRPSARAALAKLAQDAQDAPYLAGKAAEAETARLQSEARKAAIRNARDDVRPSGGFRGLIYDRTGLPPSQQDAGALAALKDGAITDAQFAAFLDDPAKLMSGNAGNNIVDRLAAMAESGKLRRDPDWTPPAARAAQTVTRAGQWGTLGDVPQSVQDDAFREFFAKNPGASASATVRDGELILTPDLEVTPRNPIAYRATAEANQRRVTEALAAVRADTSLPDAEREAVASAITGIGNTSSRKAAEGIVADTLDKVAADRRGQVRAILSPLAGQIKR